MDSNSRGHSVLPLGVRLLSCQKDVLGVGAGKETKPSDWIRSAVARVWKRDEGTRGTKQRRRRGRRRRQEQLLLCMAAPKPFEWRKENKNTRRTWLPTEEMRRRGYQARSALLEKGGGGKDFWASRHRPTD